MMLFTSGIIVAVCILTVKWNIADSSFVDSQSITKKGGEIAVFSCTGNGTGLTWIVDNSLLVDTPEIKERNIKEITADPDQVLQTVQSNLTVPATTINNGTNVICTISDSIAHTFEIAVNATLIVLPGIGGVRGLRFNDFFNKVIWDKPFTAGVSDDQLQYNLTVTNLNINSAIVDTVTNKTNHSFDTPPYCTRYQAVVTPFAVGLNGEAVSATQKLPGEFYQLVNIMVNVTDIGVQTTFDVNLTINLMLTGSLPCPGQKLIYQTHPRSNVSDIVNHTEVMIEVHQLQYNFTTEFERKQLYTAIINRISDEGNIEAWMLNFSTFDIQGCDIHNDYTFILVECTFTNNSIAPGFVVIQNEQGHTTSKMLQRLENPARGSANFTGLSAGEYSIKVFDQMGDNNPAYKNKTMLYQLPSTPTPTSTAGADASTVQTVQSTSTPEESPNTVGLLGSTNIIIIISTVLGSTILVLVLAVIILVIVVVRRTKNREGPDIPTE